MSLLLPTVHSALDYLAAAPAAPTTPANGGIPNPGHGTAFPGSAGLLTILGWVAWGVFAVIVGGVLVQAGKMGMAKRHGDGVEVTGGLVLSLMGAVIAGSASAIVGAVLV